MTNKNKDEKIFKGFRPEALPDDELCAVAGGQDSLAGNNPGATVWINGIMYYVVRPQDAISCTSFRIEVPDPAGLQKKYCPSCEWHHQAVACAGEAEAAKYAQNNQVLCRRPSQILQSFK
jgi:hypothetical protein